MSRTLYHYYEAELHFIRELAHEFGRKYPAAAARLQLERDRSVDPHVERLIEAFALLSARVRNKIHDEFPELTDAMLSVLYPHLLAPIPSVAVVQFRIDPSVAVPEGIAVKRHSPLTAPGRPGTAACRFRTAYDAMLWPIEVAEAKLMSPPFPPGFTVPVEAQAALILRLRMGGELTFATATIDSLRFHAMGDASLTAPLYDLLFAHHLETVIGLPDKPKSSLRLTPGESVAPVGFADDEGLYPYPPNVFAGYRLLAEYFSYPAKFLFFDLKLGPRVRELTPGKELQVTLFLNRTHPRLEQLLNATYFRLGCTPAVNLFEQTAEPIGFTHTKPDYPVVPVVNRPKEYEVYSIEQVTAASSTGANREFRPFYRNTIRSETDGETAGELFWSMQRRPSFAEDDRGGDVFLHLTQTGFDPAAATGETLVVRTLCTNRDQPMRLPRIGDEVRFDPAFAAPGLKVQCLRNPSVPLRSDAAPARYWHLISHLNLNHLSMTGDDVGTEAFQALLRLYEWNDSEADPQATASARQAIDGIQAIRSERTTAWIGAGSLGGFARGLKVILELDESRYGSASGTLFAAVLEQFFGLYVTINSFTQLVLRYKQRHGDAKRWPPRAGDRPLG